MFEIRLENGDTFPLRGKSLLILPPGGSQIKEIVNNDGDYDVILVVAGIDRTVNIELHKPATIIIEGGINTTVNVTGGMALPISKVVLIRGQENVVNGAVEQNRGKVLLHGEAFDLGAISEFEKVDIN